MSTSKSILEYFLECLSDVPDLRAKAMFGEYGIYSGDRMFALACDGSLFFKTTPETISHFSDTTTKAYPGSRNTAPANPEWLENRDELTKMSLLTLKHISVTKQKEKKA